MVGVLAFFAVLLLMPLVPVLSARMGAGNGVLESSFAEQSVRVGEAVLPTSALDVVHRFTGMAEYSRQGGLMEIDATWLCRAPDGTWLVALGQGLRTVSDMAVMPWNRKPLPITWTWRYPSEAHVRAMLGSNKKVYRRVFGGK